MAENLKQRGIISEVDEMVLTIDPFGHAEDEDIKLLEKTICYPTSIWL